MLHSNLCFKKLYQTCVKTSPFLLIRSVVHKKTAYMLPVQVLWEMSSKMSTVQTAALVPVPPAQGKPFPRCLGMPVACCQLPASQPRSSGASSQDLDPHLPDGNFLLDFYVNVRTSIKSNNNSNSRLCLSCKYKLCCMVQSDLKYSYITTDILPLRSFPNKLLLWTQNKTMRL